MATRRKALQQAHWSPGQSLLQERNLRPLTTLPTAQVEIFTSSETMVWKQTIEVNIASLRKDCAVAHRLQIWMHAICVKRTHGEQMPLNIQIGPLCKPLRRTTRYLVSRDAALRDFLHPKILHAHEALIYWTLRSRFPIKSLCQKSSPQEIKYTSRRGEIVSISLRIIVHSHSKLSQQLKRDSTHHSNGNMTIRDSPQSNNCMKSCARDKIIFTWRTGKSDCNQLPGQQKFQAPCSGKKSVAKWIILWTSYRSR